MKKILYVTYDGLLDPLGQSQVLPYVEALAKTYQITVLSYEKEGRSKQNIDLLHRKLKSQNIEWQILPFGNHRFSFFSRVVSGILKIRRIVKSQKIKFVHLRGFMAMAIFSLSFISLPYLYDFRGFAVNEWVDIGKVKKRSVVFYILKFLDIRSVRKASALIVLENSAEQLLRETYAVPDVPVQVIRTCTNVELYKERKFFQSNLDSRLNFVYLGGARPPYRPDLALQLISRFLKEGIDCKITFINENDHKLLKNLKKARIVSDEKVRIKTFPHSEIPKKLADFDCGIIALDTSPWRRVCSPTKLGEYLAAGLPVFALEGIDVTDRLSTKYKCVELFKEYEVSEHSKLNIEYLVELIFNEHVTEEARRLAIDEFDIHHANQKYKQIYDSVFEKIS